jgi:hypothetical protein
MRKNIGFCPALFLLVLLIGQGCGPTSSANMPLVTPPVRTATPEALESGTGGSLKTVAKTSTKTMVGALNLDTPDIKDRFFTEGPTSIFTLLTSLDNLITDANRPTSSSCLTQTPVAYTITPYGQTVTMYAQCYLSVHAPTASDPGFIQFGVQNGLTYIYSASGAERTAAIVTPLMNGEYQVQSWIGLGYSNPAPWDAMSYGVMQLSANSETLAFELSVAGSGFGYCGLQMISDGTNIFTEGSVDMGTTCNASGTLCVLASDGTTTGDCSGLSFTLPALGRKAVTAGTNGAASDHGASGYPSTPNITLTGASGDDLYFGPLTPTSGVGAL